MPAQRRHVPLLARPTSATHVLDQLDELVLKPVEGSGGYGIVFGPHASDAPAANGAPGDPRRPARLDRPAGRALSTAPTKVDDRLVPRHVDLRPFAVNDGDDVWVLPGGLTRVALPEGSLVVNSSQGGGCKDTWVLAAGRAPEADRRAGRAGAGRPSRPPARRPPRWVPS